MVNMSQSVPSTQVVSSVVAPPIPLPAQVVEEPLRGLSVPEEGVEAKAGKMNAKDRARKKVTLSFKFEGIALSGGCAETIGHKSASSFRFLMARKPLRRSPYRGRQPRLCITHYFVNTVNTVFAICATVSRGDIEIF
jgi:hypothetical protein